MIEEVQSLMVGKTIEKIEFASWSAPNDTLILFFNDKTSIKIISDPECLFDGLAFYTQKFKTEAYYEEIK